MGMFFKPAELQPREVKPFDAFPVALLTGSLSGIVFADQLAEEVFVHHLIASALKDGPAYHIGPGGLSVRVLEKLSESTSNLYAGSAYTAEELMDALKLVEEDSLVVVRRFPLLLGLSGEDVVEVKRTADERGLTVVLSHSSLELNELDLPGEFGKLFLLPEIFDLLAVLRTSSYRGHYRMNITVLRAPAEYVASVGDHSIPIDSLARPFLHRG
ncbi:hypothetical protein [Thermococcus sp.]|uniref:hypothetical protein n=1 Tax=Thermococcus sp. TaxID=35749 RepID=UPI00262F8F32|nr:hypothetical protein [Thermococcus sp.]